MTGVLELLLPRGAARPLSVVSALYVPSTQLCACLLALAMRWRDAKSCGCLPACTGQTLKACRDAYAAPFDVRFFVVA